MPDLLFLSQRLPYPPIRGDKIRVFQDLKYLARHYDVHLGCLVDDPADWQYVDTVGAMCRDIHAAPINPRLARLTCLRGLLTGEPLSVTFFRDRGLAAWVRDVLQRVRPAVTFVYSSNMAPYVLDLPRTTTRVVELADVDSEKWRALAATRRGPMHFVYQREWRKVAALERRIAHESDLSVFASDAEAAFFARQVPQCSARIRGVSNGVDHGYFDPALSFPPAFDTEVPTYVFTGTMDYPPNVDAVVWFASGILPLIRRAVPAARFFVVGSNPTAEVRGLAAIEGVVVTGRVPDVRPYVAHATAAVAPLRIARGIQNKVLEAMAMAKPVVLTSGALEGIEAEPSREVILADTEVDFAAACSRLAMSGDTAGVGLAARARILRDYDWDARLRRYDDVLCPAPAVIMA
jgi:sugar transferase (PEP-CTERM/EpsH1 system associated)